MNESQVNPSEDLGFGNKFVGKDQKLINEDGSFNITRIGTSKSQIYELLVRTNWFKFLLILSSGFIATNAIFAMIFYMAGVENIRGLEYGSPIQNFMQCFFLSIQTFTSVGYGALAPNGLWTNIIASINALVGLIMLAILTGLSFARFAKAPTQILFSKNALISLLNNKKTLQFRIVNASDTILMQVEASMTMTWIENVNGVARRKFQRLHFQLESIYLFPLNWTLVHEIDENSPLFGCDKTFFESSHVEFLVMIRAYNDTYGQNVFRNYSYHYQDIVQNARFLPMYDTSKDSTVLHIKKLNDYEIL